MADAAIRSGPLARDMPAVVTPLAPMTRLSARGGPEAARRLGSVFGVDLPMEAMRANEVGARAALWQGPDEWLLLAPEEPGLSGTVEAGLAGEAGCVVDISHRQAAFSVIGPGAAAALNAGCPLDLDLAVFPAGMCTRTVLAKADIVLWRRGPERFHVESWRSFTPYVFAFLQQAIADNVG